MTSRQTIFVDRSLGKQVVEALRRYGAFNILTMDDVYGNDGQRVEDTEWLRRAGNEGWIVLTQDAKIARRPHEFTALQDSGTHVFCLPSATLPVTARGLYIGRHLLNIIRRAKRPEPCFWRLHPGTPMKDLR